MADGCEMIIGRERQESKGLPRRTLQERRDRELPKLEMQRPQKLQTLGPCRSLNWKISFTPTDRDIWKGTRNRNPYSPVWVVLLQPVSHPCL